MKRTGRIAVIIFAFIIWIAALVILQIAVDFRRFIAHVSIGILLLAIIDAIIAKNKNKSGLLWFLLTIILGPLATLILILF